MYMYKFTHLGDKKGGGVARIGGGRILGGGNCGRVRGVDGGGLASIKETVSPGKI